MQRIPVGVQVFVDDPIEATKGQYGTFIVQDQGGTYALPCEQGHSPVGLRRVGNGSATIPAGQWGILKLSNDTVRLDDTKGEASQYSQQTRETREATNR